jgi:hypothetical protein
MVALSLLTALFLPGIPHGWDTRGPCLSAR